METQPITCKAAVCWAPNEALKVENVIVAVPQKGEVE
jgi:Zn-dependent alcohol dehydrogenase